MAERDSGEEDGRGAQRGYGHRQQMDTQELASKMVLIQNKRFYLDVKENSRGRFIKIAEVTPGGNKNRLTLSMPIATEFRNLLGDFIEHYAQLGPTDPDHLQQEDINKPLKTERIIRENKRYFLDLKENRRGRYLRVRQQQAFPIMGPGPQQPPQIALPAQGMIEFRDALTGVIDEYGQDETDVAPLPSSTVIGERRSKQFFMDIGQNQRGVYVRVTEQTRYFRSAITIPERYWNDFSKFFADAEDQLKNPSAGDAPSCTGDGSEGEEGSEVTGQRRRDYEYDDDEEVGQKKD